MNEEPNVSRDQKIFCGVVGDDDGGSLTVRGSSAVVKKPESPMTATWLVKKDFIIMSSFSDEVDWASTPNFCPPDWTETKKCPGGARRFLVEFRSRVRPGSSTLTTAHSATHFYYFSLCTIWLTLFHSRSQWITYNENSGSRSHAKTQWYWLSRTRSPPGSQWVHRDMSKDYFLPHGTADITQISFSENLTTPNYGTPYWLNSINIRSRT